MNTSRKLWIPGPAGKLEAVLRLAASPVAAVVLAHPHPMHGGTMHNSVIFHSDRELNRAGWTTLRFNFRGVEKSEGTFDGGLGEVDDVAAAVSWLRGLVPDRSLYVVGFSFGAVCAIEVASRNRDIAGAVAIGMATQHHTYENATRLKKPFAVVQGELDELSDLETVRRVVAAAHGKLYVVEGTGHLFQARARDAAAKVVEAAQAMLDG